MTEFLLIPPVAFLIYLLLVAVLSGIGRVMAGTDHPSSAFKSSAYASGEAPHMGSGAPGYRPFFRVALFFAVLHLGVLVLASGGAVHNLRAIAASDGRSIPDWARAFDDWLAANVANGDIENLINYRTRAPGAVTAHPRDEHFLPLFVAMGAAGERLKGDRLHTSFTRGSLSMAAFRFGSTED